MKHAIRTILTVLLCFALGACLRRMPSSKTATAPIKPLPVVSQLKATPPPPPVWVYDHPHHFSRIDVKGPIHVKVIGTNDQQETLVHLNNQAVSFHVDGNTLFIKPTPTKQDKARHRRHKARHHKRKPLPIQTVKILATDLRAVHLTHGPSVTLENVKSRHGLTVIDESRGDLILKGHIKLTKLIKHDPGLVRIQWVDSHCLSVVATEGDIHLAGVVGQLHVKASGSTRADLKSLRAYHAFIDTYDSAQVHVLALQSLHAFAEGHSFIDYYKHPKQLFINTQEQGQVVQIAAWR